MCSLFGFPLGKLDSLKQLGNVALEGFHGGDGVLSLDVVHVGVDGRGLASSNLVGADHVSSDRVSGAVGVAGDNTGLNRLVLTVNDDFFPGGLSHVSCLVTTVEHNTVVVQLLDVVDSGEGEARLPVVFLEESFGDVEEGELELVLELEGGGSAGRSLGVEKAVVGLSEV